MMACMEVARACVSKVRMYGLTALDNRNDALRLKLYIDSHYAEPLNTETLAGVLHVGKTKLYAVCEKRFHTTPMQMVTHARIAAAQELLTTTHESIKAIALAVGFDDQNYFAKIFRKETGLSPTAYRKSSSTVVRP